ncbi:unnamed protein product, partial [Rotaria socialis]
MLWLSPLCIVVFISLNSIIYACDKDPNEGASVVAVGSFLAASSDQGDDWSPAETKGQMKFNQGTCRYEKIVQGLPVNTNYEWKVAFNGDWVGDKGCIGSSNCQFNSGSSGVVLLIYNSYNGELTTRPLTSAETTTLDAPTSTAVPT